jgi:type III secretory pathway lipoprotein EscJ
MDAHSPAAARRRQGPRVTPAQVIALGLVAASIGWAVWLLRDHPISEEVELLPGTVLPSSELAIVEAAFDRAQLTGHRTEDGRIWVSRPRQSAYMRALVDAEALPREFGSSLRRALEQNSPWQSRAVQEEILRVAVQEELAHVICSMPGIERAAVLYDVEDRPAGLAGGPTRTASVNVRTQPDTELEPFRVQAIRVLVAASIAGLDPERVAVTDLRSGRVHAGPLEQADPADVGVAADPQLARRIAHERHLAGKIRQGLSFVKGTVVDVTVTFTPPPTIPTAPEPDLPPRQQRVADANAPAEIDVAAEAPVAVRAEPSPADRAGEDTETIVVSVAVPESWFETALNSARHRDPNVVGEEVDRVTEERLRMHVLQLLPPGSRPESRRVVVTRFPVAPGRAYASPRGMPSAAAAPPVATPPSAGKLQTMGAYVDATWQALAAGRPADVPRQVWIVVMAKCSAILAFIFFRSGTRSGRGDADSARVASARPEPTERIDWSNLGDASERGDTAAKPSPRHRVAA